MNEDSFVLQPTHLTKRCMMFYFIYNSMFRAAKQNTSGQDPSAGRQKHVQQYEQPLL